MRRAEAEKAKARTAETLRILSAMEAAGVPVTAGSGSNAPNLSPDTGD